jgi:hypothetical protein
MAGVNPAPATRKRHAPEALQGSSESPQTVVSASPASWKRSLFRSAEHLRKQGPSRRATQDSRKIISYLRQHGLSTKAGSATVPLMAWRLRGKRRQTKPPPFRRPIAYLSIFPILRSFDPSIFRSAQAIRSGDPFQGSPWLQTEVSKIEVSKTKPAPVPLRRGFPPGPFSP